MSNKNAFAELAPFQEAIEEQTDMAVALVEALAELDDIGEVDFSSVLDALAGIGLKLTECKDVNIASYALISHLMPKQ